MPDLRDSSRTDRLDLRAVYETSGFLTSLDLDFVLNNLLLVAMSKMLTTRGALLLDEHRTAHTDRDYRVAAAKGMGRDPGGLVAEGRPLRLFGDYLIEQLIARGGMGAVFRAQHARTGQQVAL
ncbi:MAG: hypothetical protein AAFV01_12860, partial [Bacteroidota bacterium]